MARTPNLLVVLPSRMVLSLPPKAVKAFLQSVADGTPIDLTGKVLGKVAFDADCLGPEGAKELMATLFPNATSETVPTVEVDASVAA